jgi:hypothetical protein
MQIAVKRLKNAKNGTEMEFTSEVEILGRIRQKNLLSFLGIVQMDLNAFWSMTIWKTQVSVRIFMEHILQSASLIGGGEHLSPLALLVLSC